MVGASTYGDSYLSLTVLAAACSLLGQKGGVRKVGGIDTDYLLHELDGLNVTVSIHPRYST